MTFYPYYLVCTEPFESSAGVFTVGQEVTDPVLVALLSADHAFYFVQIPAIAPYNGTYYLLGF